MHVLWLAIFVIVLCIQGCARTITPISDGFLSDLPIWGSPTVVWNQHKGAAGETVTMLQKMGMRIVERSRLQQVFDEQKIILTHSTDDDAQILKVGKIIGAGSIVFVEVETSASQVSRAFVGLYGGSSRSETVTNASVSVRAVDVESGEVLWTGTAHYPEPINNPEAAIIYLAQQATIRGLCPAGAWKNEAEGCDWLNAYGTGGLGFEIKRKETRVGKQLLIVNVIPNSPAELAGLKEGDVFLSCNGKSGFRTNVQAYMACKADAGQSITVQVKRGDKITTISATSVLYTELYK